MMIQSADKNDDGMLDIHGERSTPPPSPSPLLLRPNPSSPFPSSFLNLTAILTLNSLDQLLISGFTLHIRLGIAFITQLKLYYYCFISFHKTIEIKSKKTLTHKLGPLFMELL